MSKCIKNHLLPYCIFHFNLEDTTKQFSIGDDLVIIQKIYNKYFENYNQFNTISDIIIGISLSQLAILVR